MATSKGVVQGYTGVAAVDEKAQIIVDAQAHGTGSEQELLLPVINATATLRAIDTVITADADYHSQANLKALAERQINACIPDNGYRKRDERYADQYLHAAKPDPLWGSKPEPQIFPAKAKCQLLAWWERSYHQMTFGSVGGPRNGRCCAAACCGLAVAPPFIHSSERRAAKKSTKARTLADCMRLTITACTAMGLNAQSGSTRTKRSAPTASRASLCDRAAIPKPRSASSLINPGLLMPKWPRT